MSSKYVIMGGTGHVGSVVAAALLALGENVIVVARSREHTELLQAAGAAVAITDAHDAQGLRKVFQQAERLFLLNPPALPLTDAEAEENRSVASIVEALKGSGLRKIVAQSTYGAQPGQQIGDLGVLYKLERALAAQSIPTTVMRVAYLMSNWDAAISGAREKGTLPTFFPAKFLLPMVAPKDVGAFAVDLLIAPEDEVGLHFIEGPARYAPADVAAALQSAFRRAVRVEVAPEENWNASYRALGFSEAAARSYTGMTAATLRGEFPPLDRVTRGKTTLTTYFGSKRDKSEI